MRPATVETEDSVQTSAFLGYVRQLTSEGGILIIYRDADTRWRFTAWRILVWSLFTWAESSMLFHHWPFGSLLLALFILVLIGVWNCLIVVQPITVMRSIEIRADCMIIEGTDVFKFDHIGDNWPALQPDDKNPDRLVLGGIYGTRFVEYVTAHRIDRADRTPELLAQHLKDAMEQLWGRTELVFNRPD